MTSKDEALFDFTARVLDLARRTRGQKVERFAKTAVPTADLAKLGSFISDLANFLSSRSQSKVTARVKGNGMVSPEQSAEDMKPTFEALDAASTTPADVTSTL